jgi:hypothetical protein
VIKQGDSSVGAGIRRVAKKGNTYPSLPIAFPFDKKGIFSS